MSDQHPDYIIPLNVSVAEIQRATEAARQNAHDCTPDLASEWNAFADKLDHFIDEIREAQEVKPAREESLARELFDANRKALGGWGEDDPRDKAPSIQDIYLAMARTLIESGWRKGGPS